MFIHRHHVWLPASKTKRVSEDRLLDGERPRIFAELRFSLLGFIDEDEGLTE